MKESFDIIDEIKFVKIINGIVYFSVNGEKRYKKFDKLSFFMKKHLALSTLK